jgi:GDSL-like lipase/acylhydrolase family protein
MEGTVRSAAWVAAAAVLVGLWMVPAASAGSDVRQAAIVALGDSIASGEGGRWLGNGSEPFGTRSGTDRAAFGCDGWVCQYDPARIYGATEESGCHRSDVAPILSAAMAAVEKVDLACSGARVANVWPGSAGGRRHFGEAPQTDQLAAVARRDEVRMIVLTVGANDVGFGDLVVDCALDWARSPEDERALCRDDAQAELAAALPRMERGLLAALRGIRATMAAAGYRHPDYRLVAMGYASPFPPGRWIRYPEEGWSRLSEGGCPVWNADADWAASVGVGSIVAAMRRAAAAAGSEFLDIRHALDGHQVCDRRSRRVGSGEPSPASAEWVRRLAFVQGSSRESLHPNAYGQRAIGTCIGLLYASPSGNYNCQATPGRGYVDGMGLDPLAEAP